uniref:replicative DNA helicase n=1 Tax=Ningiella ruwaisensis TaxID=2364274 RepID=UPI00109F0BB1|nr:replicative DNA helicase [Ningiella ruwaisensis]
MAKSSQDNIEKLNIPPHSIEAEQSVLGSLMISPDAWDKVADLLIESDFYNRSHRVIFAAILRLIGANESVDTVTVKDNLAKHNQLEDAGGFAYLIELAKNTPSAANVAAYASSIREKAIVREVIGVAHDIAEVGYNPEGRDSKEVLDLAESKVFEIAEKRTAAGEGPVDVKSVLKKTVDRLDELVKQDADVTGVSTGFHDLDKKTSGLQPSDLIIVAARPSMGKCIAAESQLVDPCTGAIKTIEEMVEKQNGEVLSLNDSFKIKRNNASNFVNDGKKPVFRVTTALGRKIETTLTHPFLTGTGWRALEELREGEQIAVPRKLDIFGKTHAPEHAVKAIAYFISDGGTTQSSPLFTNTNERIVKDFTEAMEMFDGVRVRSVNSDNRAPSYRASAKSGDIASVKHYFSNVLNEMLNELKISGKALAKYLNLRPSTISQWRNSVALPLPQSYEALSAHLGADFEQRTRGCFYQSTQRFNSLTSYLKEVGLWGKHAHQKVLPDCLFTLKKELVALCLNRMFACDGGIYLSKTGQVRASYATASETLAYQVQHLLLRFGILSKLRKKKPFKKTLREDKANTDGALSLHSQTVLSTSNECDLYVSHAQYEVEILHSPSLHIFIQEIGMHGKEARINECRELLSNKKHHSNVDSLPDSVVDYILTLKGTKSWSSIFAHAGIAFPKGFNPHFSDKTRRRISRERVKLFAELFKDEYLRALAESDVYWDTIKKIEYVGYKQVYDLTVPGEHNFIAQDICVHNTTFAMNLCENAMMMQDKPVLVFSLEMPAEQIMMRMLASLSRVNQTKIRTAKLDDTDWVKLQQTMQSLHEKDNLFIDDSSGLTPMELRTRARKLARERGGISLIMVDYLQLMRVPSLSDNRTLEIAEISRSLKALAKELEVPVVALSQLNRGLEQRSDKRPINSDLRESGSIEQDADLIMFIYRDEVYHENSEYKGIAEIIIGKQRNGPIGTSRLTFQGQFSRFDNYAGPDFADEY